MAHADDRQRGGQRAMFVPDFLICAHALLESTGLLTRDARPYRQAFSGLRLILTCGPSPSVTTTDRTTW